MLDFADASKSGVAQETLQNTVRRASKAMTEQEARQILGVSEQTAWDEILKVSIACVIIFFYYYCCVGSKISFYLLQKYDALFERNAKNGSFYLQSKVHRAKECLESVYRDKGQGTPS